MARSRRTARHARRRERSFPRAAFAAGPVAIAATGVVVGLGVQNVPAPAPEVAATDAPPPRVSATDAPPEGTALARDPLVSRSERRPAPPAAGAGARPAAADTLSPAAKMMRPAAIRRAVESADTTQWTTTDLNLWTGSDESAEQVGLLDTSVKVLLAGRELAGRQEIVVGGEARWVTAGCLAAEKPVPEPALGGQCDNGTSVPAGVSPNIRAVHQAVCSNFPEITTYGTLRSDGEHAQGIAVDIMVSGDRGWEVAQFIRSNSSALGVSYAIHARNIWSVQRSAEGWRGMEDRGSVTANHYDHVHVTTY
jgi:hypothetical protein